MAMCNNCKRPSKKLVGKLVFFAALCYVGGMAFANEEWSGTSLTIYGDRDTDTVYEKRMDGETLVAYWVKLGTVDGSARLVANDSTLTLTSDFYLGLDADPGYTNLTSTLVLTNSTLTCSRLLLGTDMTRALTNSVVAEIGPGSSLSCTYYRNYGSPWPRIRFTGGRMVFNGTDGYLGHLEGHTWKGGWPNNGVYLEGKDAPIDLEVNNDRKLAGGWAARSMYLIGNGGLVKRGTGKLTWGWFKYGTNPGYFNGSANYTGDTVIKAGGIELATPSGEEPNMVRCFTPAGSILKIEEGAYFDFAGNPATFLGVSGAGMLTNSAATATALTLGSTGGDGEFSPALIGGAFDVIKSGTGTLTVAVSHIDGKLWASNGTVRVASGASFAAREIRIGPCATLDVRGVHVTCDVLSASPSAIILWDGDTVFDCKLQIDSDETQFVAQYDFPGSLRKMGAGTLTFLGSSAKSEGTISIEEGTVVCRPASAWSGKYYRVNYFGDASLNSTNSGVAFSEFSLYGIDGKRVNQGTYAYTPLAAGPKQKYGGYGGIDDATQLAECEVAVWMPNHDGFFQYDANNYSPAKIFDGDTSAGIRNTWYWADSNVLVFRIKNSAPEVVGFSFTTDDNPARRPTQWKLWGSVDGAAWTVLADNSTNRSDAAVWTYLTNSTPATARTEYNIQLLDKLPAASANYAPFGDAEVSVADGAMLDFASAEMTLSCLKVDLDASGGTITRCTPATNGVINLSATSPVASGRVIPLTVTEMASPNNLKSWTVKVNGVERADLGVRWSNGVLRVSGGGLQVIFR